MTLPTTKPVPSTQMSELPEPTDADAVGDLGDEVAESVELAIAAAQGSIEELPSELADLFYHALVLMSSTGLKPQQVWDELKARQR